MKSIRLIGGPLELDGLEVPCEYRTALVLEDNEFVPHLYWVINPRQAGWVGEYRGVYKKATD